MKIRNVSLTGRICRPAQATSKSGRSYWKFGIQISQRTQNKDTQEWSDKKEPIYFNCITFHDEQPKDKAIAQVIGQLDWNHYEGKLYYTIIANDIIYKDTSPAVVPANPDQQPTYAEAVNKVLDKKETQEQDPWANAVEPDF